MQKVLFPGTHMRITQDELSTYSHAGSYARDDGGESTTKDSPVLAPFDGYVARVRTGSSHETYFVSDGPVEWANGYQGVTTFLFMHDNINRVRQGQHTFRRLCPAGQGHQIITHVASSFAQNKVPMSRPSSRA